ncbi:MAG: hypothetical protein ACK5MU_01005 [Candidatus Saccharimonadales bacterium]
MKKIRTIVLILTIVQAAFIIFAIVMQFVIPSSAAETAFEVFALVSSAVSIVIAVIVQLESYRERNETARIIRELNEIDAQLDAERALDKSLRKKLDELTAMDSRIYRKLSKKPKK